MLGFSSIKKLFGGLARTREDLGRRLTEAWTGGRIDEAALEAIEEALIAADVGVATAGRVVMAVRTRSLTERDLGSDDLRRLVASELEASLAEVEVESAESAPGRDDPFVAGLEGSGVSARNGSTESAAGMAAEASSSKSAHPASTRAPRVVLLVGVNGGGKTTTAAKLASRQKADGRSVILAAADTFRAAATEQLVVWGERAGVGVVKHGMGADASAVVFDAARAAVSRGMDVLIVDTAGRLHTKGHLMQELQKIARVAGREIPGAPHETLLVMDATTGQNGLSQAREFARAVPITGLVLTKLDGTARGGVALAIARELRIPIRYVGVGEGMDDLLDFDPRAFIASLIGEETAPRAERAP